MSPKKLRKRYICSDHFDKAMYMNSTCVKPRLIQNVLPNKYSTGNWVKIIKISMNSLTFY